MKRDQSIKRPVAHCRGGDDYFHSLLPILDGPREFDDVQLWDFSGIPFGSAARWVSLFKTLKGYDTVRAIGLIRDAEEDAAAKADELRGAFRNAGLAVPPNPGQIMPATPSTGYLIIPSGQPSGCIEDAFLDAVLPEAQIACARKFLECVDRLERNNAWRSKVLVHSLISASDKPSSTLGQSVKQGKLWDFIRPSLSAILDFVRGLVNAMGTSSTLSPPP